MNEDLLLTAVVLPMVWLQRSIERSTYMHSYRSHLTYMADVSHVYFRPGLAVDVDGPALNVRLRSAYVNMHGDSRAVKPGLCRGRKAQVAFEEGALLYAKRRGAASDDAPADEDVHRWHE
jgi:hypothetical protein